MKTNKKYDAFTTMQYIERAIEDNERYHTTTRKANYWRGFRAALVLMFAIIGLSVTIYYATQKPCQEYYVCDPANLCCGIER